VESKPIPPPRAQEENRGGGGCQCGPEDPACGCGAVHPVLDPDTHDLDPRESWPLPLSWNPCPLCGGLDTHTDDCEALPPPLEYDPDHDQ